MVSRARLEQAMIPRDLDPLGRAFAVESRLGARLAAFAAMAEREGQDDLARLMKALAASQEARTRRYLMLLRGKIGDSAANLAGLVTEELPGLLAEHAELILALAAGGEKPAANALEQAVRVEREALDILRGADETGGLAAAWQVCQVCGYVKAGEPPERCPVCGANAARFTRVE
jgi:rubrerythrin